MQLRLAGEQSPLVLATAQFCKAGGFLARGPRTIRPSKETAQRAYSAQKGPPSLPKNECGHISSGV
jgi:hypothetical protein